MSADQERLELRELITEAHQAAKDLRAEKRAAHEWLTTLKNTLDDYAREVDEVRLRLAAEVSGARDSVMNEIGETHVRYRDQMEATLKSVDTHLGRLLASGSQLEVTEELLRRGAEEVSRQIMKAADKDGSLSAELRRMASRKRGRR